ncbi:MAG: selenide, water dikinase SelD [Chloroflexi bacterium RBG_13_56_8]|nr:MAG: selenide, water dikinase SelD [Chloroflexi bacterium RBG_13_56_8]
MARVTRHLQDIFDESEYPDLLVGLSMADDAAVWKVSEDRALIFTTDFFTPVVDDPYDYGAIAAANALSDVYAMGGEPFLALNLAGFPAALPEDIIVDIFRGAAEKVQEAGAIVAGGHTVDDDEPKFGLAVLGFVHPDKVLTKATAKPGDVLVLTKPLGVGIIVTAYKSDQADLEHVAIATDWMKRLNRDALAALQGKIVHALTDITGFGLLGHAWEMAIKSGVAVRIRFDDLPFHPGAAQYADELLFPAGANNNMGDYGEHVTFAAHLEYESRLLCFCPETSGGLFISLPPHEAERFLADYAASGHEAWRIGEVLAGEPHIAVY